MTWKKGRAKSEIRRFFRKHRVSASKATAKASDGKIYELYCLVGTLDWLKREYGAHITFKGSTVDFKASPGNIDRSRSYFEVRANGQMLELHTDIEIRTLGTAVLGSSHDNSGYHESDLVLVEPAVPNGEKPQHNQLFLGVECKAHANFNKAIVKQVLGVRRELSMYNGPHDCKLDLRFGRAPKSIMAEPASLYWLVFSDSKGLNYSQSPGAFEIDFKNWRP